MDISLFIINSIVCAMLWLMGRICCAWLGRLSDASAGQTIRDVERHLDQVQRHEIPQEKTFAWLMRISPRPKLTALLHYLFRFFTSLPLVALVFGLTLPFVPAWEVYVRYFHYAVFILYWVIFLAGLLLHDPLFHRWTGKYTRY